MAVYGLKGFGWFVTGMIVAPACYMVTSQVAAERARLVSVESAIIQAHQEIRGLETEFNTRANLAQLERWNGEALAMAAPTPQQFIADEQGLAQLDQPGAQVQTAALIVPKGATPAAAVAAATAETAQAAVPASARPAKPAGPAPSDSGLSRVRGQAMAMLDEKLLSSSTMEDIRQRARSEALALR